MSCESAWRFGAIEDYGVRKRVDGIEPTSFGWKPEALPLSYTREETQ